MLRDRQMLGHKFRRPFPIDAYIVDFCCTERKLVVEIDGDSHAESTGDAQRTRELEAQGYHVIRFTNTEVHEEFEAVTDAILAACERSGA